MYCDGLNDNTHAAENCILKITVSDFLNVEEAHSHGFAVATAYPNPGRNTLNIRTALPNAHIEIYDLTGKLVYEQEITENITSINAESWPSGTYVWKVIAGPSAGSVTLAEVGKWIKE